METLTYCFPLSHIDSFRLISEKHIQYLKKHFIVRTVDIDNIRFLRLLPADYIILHPLFYPFSNCLENSIELMYQIYKIKSTPHKRIVAFDVADSDMISEKAVFIANTLPDMIIVPSYWCKHVFIRSGVKTRIEVIPHGVPDTFLVFNSEYTLPPELYRIRYSKKKKLLFFCTHSPYRKGLDIVVKAVKKLREKRNDFILIVRCGVYELHLIENELKDVPYIAITRFMNENELRTLYDISDILLLPSRGGGFELNGLESLIRNRPVIYPKTSCIEEYAGKIIPELSVEVGNRPTVLKGNKIHVGRGHEVDLDDFIEKVDYCLNNIQYFKERIEERFKREEKEKYRWENIVRRIVGVLTTL